MPNSKRRKFGDVAASTRQEEFTGNRRRVQEWGKTWDIYLQQELAKGVEETDARLAWLRQAA